LFGSSSVFIGSLFFVFNIEGQVVAMEIFTKFCFNMNRLLQSVVFCVLEI